MESSVDKQRQLQNKIQSEALKAHASYNFRSTIGISVGSGKSSCAIKRFEEHFKINKKTKALFFGCRELYLENFKSELKKFKLSKLISKIDFYCTQSLDKITEVYDIIVCDESHKHADSYILFLKKQLLLNPKIELLCLTGTPLKIGSLAKQLESIVPISIEQNIDESSEEGLINDYKIIVYRHKLDVRKNIHIKTDKYNFYTSEEANYKSLIKKYAKNLEDEAQGFSSPKSGFRDELRYIKLFFKNLNSKFELAKKIMITLGKENKTLIYAGSIEQAGKFNYPNYHSKLDKATKDKNYKDFCSGKTNVLVNVDGIKESVSVPNLKNGLVLHAGSSSSNFEQLCGRFCRLIPNKEVGTIYVLVAKDTIEENWFRNSVSNLDQKKIEYRDI